MKLQRKDDEIIDESSEDDDDDDDDENHHGVRQAQKQAIEEELRGRTQRFKKLQSNVGLRDVLKW